MGERFENSVENSGKKLEDLSSDEILNRYKVKEEDMNKAKEYLRYTNTDNYETGDDVGNFGLFENVSKAELSAEILRYISNENPNLSFGDNMLLDDLPEEDALAYISYFQELNGLKVDGIIGKNTLSRSRELLEVTFAQRREKVAKKREAMAKQQEARQWLMTALEEELANNGEFAKPDFEMKDLDSMDVDSPIFDIEKRVVSNNEISQAYENAKTASYNRRVRSEIVDLIENNQILVDGALPEMSEHARKENETLKEILSLIDNKDNQEKLETGEVSIAELARDENIEWPEDLEEMEE